MLQEVITAGNRYDYLIKDEVNIKKIIFINSIIFIN